MEFKLTNGFRKVQLSCFSGEVQALEHPDQLNIHKNDPEQYADIKKGNNIRFELISKDGNCKSYQFHNADFDFREGHFISILTSEKTGFHRLVINHNTQRFWYPNKHPYSIAKEGLWEKFLILFSIIFCGSTGLVITYFLLFPHFADFIYFNLLFWSISVLILSLFVTILYQFPKRTRNEYLFESKWKSQLKFMGIKISNSHKNVLNYIKK